MMTIADAAAARSSARRMPPVHVHLANDRIATLNTLHQPPTPLSACPAARGGLTGMH